MCFVLALIATALITVPAVQADVQATYVVTDVFAGTHEIMDITVVPGSADGMFEAVNKNNMISCAVTSCDTSTVAAIKAIFIGANYTGAAEGIFTAAVAQTSDSSANIEFTNTIKITAAGVYETVCIQQTDDGAEAEDMFQEGWKKDTFFNVIAKSAESQTYKFTGTVVSGAQDANEVKAITIAFGVAVPTGYEAIVTNNKISCAVTSADTSTAAAIKAVFIGANYTGAAEGIFTAATPSSSSDEVSLTFSDTITITAAGTYETVCIQQTDDGAEAIFLQSNAGWTDTTYFNVVGKSPTPLTFTDSAVAVTARNGGFSAIAFTVGDFAQQDQTITFDQVVDAQNIACAATTAPVTTAAQIVAVFIDYDGNAKAGFTAAVTANTNDDGVINVMTADNFANVEMGEYYIVCVQQRTTDWTTGNINVIGKSALFTFTDTIVTSNHKDNEITAITIAYGNAVPTGYEAIVTNQNISCAVTSADTSTAAAIKAVFTPTTVRVVVELAIELPNDKESRTAVGESIAAAARNAMCISSVCSGIRATFFGWDDDCEEGKRLNTDGKPFHDEQLDCDGKLDGTPKAILHISSTQDADRLVADLGSILGVVTIQAMLVTEMQDREQVQTGGPLFGQSLSARVKVPTQQVTVTDLVPTTFFTSVKACTSFMNMVFTDTIAIRAAGTYETVCVQQTDWASDWTTANINVIAKSETPYKFTDSAVTVWITEEGDTVTQITVNHGNAVPVDHEAIVDTNKIACAVTTAGLDIFVIKALFGQYTGVAVTTAGLTTARAADTAAPMTIFTDEIDVKPWRTKHGIYCVQAQDATADWTKINVIASRQITTKKMLVDGAASAQTVTIVTIVAMMIAIFF